MTVYPIDAIGSMGVITDVDSTQDSIQSFSFSINARFEDMKITRGPNFSMYRTMATNPRQMNAYTDANGIDHFVVMDNFASIFEETPKSQSDVSPTTGFTPQDSYAQITTCDLNDVIYFNRTDMTPFYRAKTSSDPFAKLENYDSGWKDTENSAATAPFPSNVRFNSLKSYNSMLIGINVTIGATTSPNMIYWSDYSIADRQPPLNWNIGSTESSSGQNLIPDLKGTLIDGFNAGQDFLLFTTREAYRMTQSGNTTSIFNFQKLFDHGILSTNCAVYHDARLWVFGDRDIYTTDGTNAPVQIADGKVRTFIYRDISNIDKDKSFVFHNQGLHEILFCYVSIDAAFQQSSANLGCNRAAVYNYQSGCWYFYDLPYVTCASLINTYTGLTWDEALSSTFTWANITGSWTGLEQGASNVVAMGSNASVAPFAASASLRTYSIYEESVATGILDSFANTPCTITKKQMPFGVLTNVPNFTSELRQYKQLSSIYVDGYLPPESGPITITVGTCDQPNDNPVFGLPMTFTQTYSQLDYNQQGRYFALNIEYDDFRTFHLDALQLDLNTLGSRGR